jgi:DnaJ-class molecular chaperone
MGPHDTDYHRLVLFVQYKRTKPELYTTVPCPDCSGMFCQVEQDRCSKCGGTQWVKEYMPYPPEPKIPDGLVEHMKKAYEEYKRQFLPII